MWLKISYFDIRISNLIAARGRARKSVVPSIAGFAVFIGAYSLFHLHWTRIKRRVEGWGYSVFVYFGAIITLIFGGLNGGKFFWSDKQDGTMFDWLYFYVQVAGGGHIFSL